MVTQKSQKAQNAQWSLSGLSSLLFRASSPETSSPEASLTASPGTPLAAHDPCERHERAWQRAVTVIVPRANDRDVLAAETFFSALRPRAPLAIEIGATTDARYLIIRGDATEVEATAALLRSAYPQCQVMDLDPARDPLASTAPIMKSAELRLREPAYLPLRTYVSRDGRVTLDDFERAGDPMLGVLAAMDGLSAIARLSTPGFDTHDAHDAHKASEAVGAYDAPGELPGELPGGSPSVMNASNTAGTTNATNTRNTTDTAYHGEACLAQLTLATMPDDWGKFWRGTARDVEERTKKSPVSLSVLLLGVFGGCACFISLTCLALAFIAPDPGLIVMGVVLMVLGIGMIALRLRLPSPPDPHLVIQKINNSAFQVRIRVYCFAASAEAAEGRLARILAAFHAYNMSGANGFIAFDLHGDVDPRDLSLPATMPAHGLLRGLPSKVAHLGGLLGAMPTIGFFGKPTDRLPTLNVSEMAGLWHLPNAQSAYQGLAAVSSKDLSPLPSDVGDEDGVYIGTSTWQGRPIEVRLPRKQLRGNIGLVAKTQSGKSNLMSLIARDVIEHEPDTCVIVIDPHSDLVRSLAANLPEARRAQSIFWSLADTERPFGLNLIERPALATGLSAADDPALLRPDKIASNIIEAFREIWQDNWGPRMEDYLRWPLLTLATANELMVIDWRFGGWLTEARIIYAGVVDAINTGRIDAQADSMLWSVCENFARLSRPLRPSAMAKYDGLVPLFQRYMSAQRAVLSGDAAGPAERVAALKDLRRALLGDAGRAELARAVFAAEQADAGAGRRRYTPEQVHEVLHAAAGAIPVQAGGSAADRSTAERPLQYTILDIQPLQVSSTMRMTALRMLPQGEYDHIRRWWDEYSMYAATNARFLLEMITPVRTKLRRFDASDIARRIFGQPESTIHLPELVDSGGVLLVDLAAGIVGKDTAALIGSTVLNLLASVLFAQARVGDRERRREVLVVVDEFQSIPGADYETMLSELAKYGARLILGTQSLGVLQETNRKLRPAWLDNTNTLFVFRTGAEDAEVLASELALTDSALLTVETSDIVGLADHTCFCRIRDASRQVRVFRVHTRKADTGDTAVFDDVRERSRQVYGRDRARVDEWIRLARREHGKADLFERTNAAPLQNGARGNVNGAFATGAFATGPFGTGQPQAADAQEAPLTWNEGIAAQPPAQPASQSASQPGSRPRQPRQPRQTGQSAAEVQTAPLVDPRALARHGVGSTSRSSIDTAPPGLPTMPPMMPPTGPSAGPPAGLESEVATDVRIE